MKCDPSKFLDRESLLATVRSAVKAAGGKRISLRQFMVATGVTRHILGRYFPRWNMVLTAAGFDFKAHNTLVDPALLLADWGAMVRKLQRLPTKAEYRIGGNFNTITFQRRFNGWCNVPAAFRAFAKQNPEWADILSLLPASRRRKYPSGRQLGTPWLTTRQRAVHRNQSTCGPLLDFGALHHAPVNEQGVIFLFGMMAEKLGFMVESLRAAFPDCEAKRRLQNGSWERLRIEFEFESRNFREHCHDVEACDLIVCWTHNWPDCPLEVIALRDEIARFRGE